MRLPSPALVIAVIALFVALGGTSYAVTQLPKNSVGTKQLKQNAVTSAKIKNGTIATADLSAAARSALRGATGATGDRGEQGPAGERSSGFRVGASGVLIENVSGATGTLDDFAITTPTAGHLLINLDLSADSPNDICGSTNNRGAVTVTLNGTTVPDLSGDNQSAALVLTVQRSALVEVGAGTHRVVMTITCEAPDTVDPLATRSYWFASGALYPARLDATTSTG